MARGYQGCAGAVPTCWDWSSAFGKGEVVSSILTSSIAKKSLGKAAVYQCPAACAAGADYS